MDNPRLVHGNVIPMGIPWETPHGLRWDGTSIHCYGIGMGQINISHGQPCVQLNLSERLNCLKDEFRPRTFIYKTV